MGASSLKGGGVLGLALLAALVVAPGGAAAPRPAPAVTCAMHSGSHRLVIHAHELRDRFQIPRACSRHFSPRERRQLRRLERQVQRTPAEIAIERRIDEVTVLDRTSSPFDFDLFAAEPPRPCARAARRLPSMPSTRSRSSSASTPAAPTCTSTSATGRSPRRHGRGRRGLGDRARGQARRRYRRGADDPRQRLGARQTARERAWPGPTTVNLNAAEASPDADLKVGHQSSVLIKGGGGNDSLSSAGDAADRDALFRYAGGRRRATTG